MAEWWDDGEEYISGLISAIMTDDFIYDSASFVFTAEPGSKSLFDYQLESTWNSKCDDGCFRYRLKDLKTKYLDGYYNFVVQQNEERATLRRRPQDISDIYMPFDPSKFNFGKIPVCEKMFDITNCKEGPGKIENEQEPFKHALIINVSPLEYCHSLFVPNIDLCYPQVLNFDSLKAAIEVMLSSANSYLRMGFNSLGAYASVNHLHFHIYQLSCNLYLETAPVEQFQGPCYYLNSYPAEGFAFEIQSFEEISNITRAIMILTDYLIAKKIPHNIFMTRGTPFSSSDNVHEHYRSLRIYVWARKPFYGTKTENTGFNLAVCELSGHLPIKDEATYNTINENQVIQSMKEICQEVISAIKEDVRALYKNELNN